MGCDIHFFVEVRENGTWSSHDMWTEDDEGTLIVALENRFYDTRNYDLFAILADVRNGFGTAGISTGKGFNPISAPRGLPKDVSKNILKESEYWGPEGHNLSWYTVDELLRYDWTQVTTKSGYLSAKSYFLWDRTVRENGRPPGEWLAGIYGPNVRILSEDDMRERVKGRQYDSDFSDLEDHYVRCEWETPYFQVASQFLSETMPRLWRLGAPEDVRIVFWFDN